MKVCPYCAEEIRDEAIKCKHCREFLEPGSQAVVSGPAAKSPKPPPLPDGVGLPWYFQTSTVMIALLSAGPLALPMVWWHPKWTWKSKGGISIAVVVLTWLMIVAIIKLWGIMMGQWNEIQEIAF